MIALEAAITDPLTARLTLANVLVRGPPIGYELALSTRGPPSANVLLLEYIEEINIRGLLATSPNAKSNNPLDGESEGLPNSPFPNIKFRALSLFALSSLANCSFE
jgi:hypothetical protein